MSPRSTLVSYALQICMKKRDWGNSLQKPCLLRIQITMDVFEPVIFVLGGLVACAVAMNVSGAILIYYGCI